MAAAITAQDRDDGPAKALILMQKNLLAVPNATDVGAHFTEINLTHNKISSLCDPISSFTNLRQLDISNNGMTYISPALLKLQHLQVLVAKHNFLNEDSIPKTFASLQTLEEVNFSANNFHDFPPQIAELTNLKILRFASNRLKTLPYHIKNCKQLEVLYLGDNKLSEIPASIGYMTKLRTLVVSDNKLETIPPVIGQLKQLQCLALHNNRLKTLPQDIIKLSMLVELSLRGNPLVMRFVRDLTYNPPSLLELAARRVKVGKLTYADDELPRSVGQYLSSAKCCVNPRCKGVYFDSRVEHVKFTDFCGKYRVPLLDYLCSPSCSETAPVYSMTSSSSDQDDTDDEEPIAVPNDKMAKVLLG